MRELSAVDIAAVRKVVVLKKLLKHRDDPRVVETLVACLKTETEPEVLKTVILGLGLVKNPEHVQALKPFLEHSSFRVMAATVQTLYTIKPELESELVHPLLVSKNPRTRSATVLALINGSPKTGLEVLIQLSRSGTEKLRKTAIACLDAAAPATAERIAVDMFLVERAPKLLVRLTDRLKRQITVKGLERLVELKAQLVADKDDAPTAKEARDRKLAMIDEVVERAYDDLDLSSGKIGTLEGKLEKLVAELAAKKEAAAKADRQAAGAEKPRPGGPGMRATIQLVVVMIMLGGLTQLVWNLQWPTGTSAAAPVPPQVIAGCALGKLGDPVAVEGKVLRIFSQQSAVVIQTANRLLIYVTFVGGLPPAARSDNQVRLEGTISGINSRVSLYVAGKKLTAS